MSRRFKFGETREQFLAQIFQRACEMNKFGHDDDVTFTTSGPDLPEFGHGAKPDGLTTTNKTKKQKENNLHRIA